jgi:hypothetical protein
MNTRTEILNAATGLINGDREKDYGTPQECFGCIADMWTAYLGHTVTAADACHMMALLKIARLRNGEHYDSSVDAAGYMALGAEISEGQKPIGAEFAKFWEEQAAKQGTKNPCA